MEAKKIKSEMQTKNKKEDEYDTDEYNKSDHETIIKNFTAWEKTVNDKKVRNIHNT